MISTTLQIACSADILGQYAKAFAHFKELSTTYIKIYPFWTFQTAEILMKCTTRGLIVKTAQKEQKYLLNYFVEAMKIVAVCAGRDSPTFAYYKKFYEDCREVCYFNPPDNSCWSFLWHSSELYNFSWWQSPWISIFLSPSPYSFGNLPFPDPIIFLLPSPFCLSCFPKSLLVFSVV